MRKNTASLVAVALLSVLCARCWADTFTVQAAPDHPTTMSVDDVKTTFASSIKTITFTLHGQTHSADAVPLLNVLKNSGLQVDLKMDPKADPKTKNLPLRQTVIITGKDGYASAIAVAELLPDIGNHEAYLAIDRDGAPLADRSAPVELIVPGDVKPGRWVRGVASISILSPSPATQP